MEMVEVDQGEECIEDASANQDGSPESSGIFGDPQATPRIGEDYQVVIPLLIPESERLQIIRHPISMDDTLANVDYPNSIGSSIPIVWVHHDGSNMKVEPLEFLGPLVSCTTTINHEPSKVGVSVCKAEPVDDLLEIGRKFRGYMGSQMDVKSHCDCKATSCYPLPEAVGIGKGKSDLTGMVSEPVKTGQSVSLRSEIPIGKACSYLTSGDIIRFLTGDFRLSKARSNDLFWEAVWPRLLARGWHSEQPKNHIGSKHALVFLIPGIKKFSRTKLVKGNHYFDSVSDVLNKVASDPGLLELEVEASTVGGINNENGCDEDTKVSQNGQSDCQRPCYLRPKLPSCSTELMKFTVVDTSLVHGEAPFKVRELRSLPAEATLRNTPSRFCGDSEDSSSDSDDTSSDHQRESENINKSISGKCMFDEGLQSEVLDNVGAASKKRMLTDGPNSVDTSPDNQDDKHQVKRTKCEFGPKVKSGRTQYLASPAQKRRRLNSSKNAPYCHIDSSAESQPKTSVASDVMVAEEHLPQQKRSTISSTKNSPEENSGCVINGNGFGINTDAESTICKTESSQDRPQRHALIDLNVPQFPPDYGFGEPFVAEVADSQEDLNSKEASIQPETSHPVDDSHAPVISNGTPSEQQPAMIGRRQSTRNRPLTTRALEALASGLFSPKRKARGTNGQSSSSRTSRRARKSAGPAGGSAAHPSTSTTTMTTMNTDYVSSGISGPKEGVDEELNTTIGRKSPICSEGRGALELLGIP
ncbi:hypothetical protein QJS10_CPA05g00473 [Acorus calamus]|uniref:DUF7650 domain-containing protein n=1 Tax=Acorus calamus TaxID=4465 RepID=A0AAV9ES50_ACOCL|nr:hypothetical protein QJS10_CPA05g00473 [Acorus calamus]